MSHSDTSSFFGEAIPSLKFGTVGDAVAGMVIDKETRQQTNQKTNRPENWADGRPKMQVILTLEVAEPTEDDAGVRRLFIRGYMQSAFRDACKAAKLNDITTGMWVAVRRTGTNDENGGYLYDAKVSPQGHPFKYTLVQSDPEDATGTDTSAVPF